VDSALTRRAERAALGAMISDPHLAPRLGILEPRDFTDPRHRAVFQAIRMLAGTEQPGQARWRDLIAATAGKPITTAYLDGLAASCPRPPHGHAYAAMLIQATLSRLARERANEIDADAGLLGYEASRLAEAGAPGAGQAASLSRHLAEVAKAIRGHTAMLAPDAPYHAVQPAPTASLAGPASLHEQLTQAAWPLAGPPQGDPRSPAPPAPAAQSEELVLSAILQGHPQAAQVLTFLPAAAFTSPAAQQVFRAARRLCHASRPVDELTVTWDLATHNATAAVINPQAPRQPPVPDGYTSRLAHAPISAQQSPLRAAHDMDAQIRFRSLARRQPDPARPTPPPAAGQAPHPAVLRLQPPPAAPQPRPQQHR
jgi:DnaB-like helicase N terminal domain